MHGIHIPHRKNTAAAVPLRMPAPKTVTIMTSMHIGKPASVIVKPGDKVYVGQPIAEANGFVSANIHASISGTVKKIDEVLSSAGSFVPAVVIESDGEMTPYENISAPVVNTYDEFISALASSGIVGLGGAGFPTHVKLDVKDTSRIQQVIISSAECEPYITSDTRTMLDRAEDIEHAIKLFIKFLGVKEFVIGIEKNKPEAISEMNKLAKSIPSVKVKVLPSSYPQGGEKVLIFNTTGKVVPAGKLPIDVGCVVCNCTTMAEIGRFFKTGMPLTEKCVTVDGDAVREPKNVIVPIGTALSDVFEFCGGFKEEPKKMLYGGPMMGLAVPSADAMILKNTNAVLAFGAKSAKEPKATQCIHCGRCVNHCPLGLAPINIAKAFETKDCEALQKLEVNLCMECGCCSYVCPARRPLVQTNKLSKAMLRDYLAKQPKETEEKKK